MMMGNKKNLGDSGYTAKTLGDALTDLDDDEELEESSDMEFATFTKSAEAYVEH